MPVKDIPPKGLGERVGPALPAPSPAEIIDLVLRGPLDGKRLQIHVELVHYNECAPPAARWSCRRATSSPQVGPEKWNDVQDAHAFGHSCGHANDLCLEDIAVCLWALLKSDQHAFEGNQIAWGELPVVLAHIGNACPIGVHEGLQGRGL